MNNDLNWKMHIFSCSVNCKLIFSLRLIWKFSLTDTGIPCLSCHAKERVHGYGFRFLVPVLLACSSAVVALKTSHTRLSISWCAMPYDSQRAVSWFAFELSFYYDVSNVTFRQADGKHVALKLCLRAGYATSMNLMALAVFSQFSHSWLDAFGASSYSKDIP
jgi:hypothetical protein